VEDPFVVFSWLGTVMFIAALVPQAIRTFQRGRADDISLLFLFTVLAGSLSMFIWAASIPNAVVAFGFVMNLLVWGYVLIVRLRPRGEPS
jgi:uncharacterized protein with PQ loop repeat